MNPIIVSAAGKVGVPPKEAERFAKFLAVGTLGFVIDFGTLTLGKNTGYPATLGLILANTISFTLAVISNYTLNRYWTYPETRSKKKRVQLPQFALVSILGLIINNVILALTTPLFNSLISYFGFLNGAVDGYMPAKILATVVVLFWNFFVNRFWTFGNVK
jgi:putative flippase GtrA